MKDPSMTIRRFGFAKMWIEINAGICTRRWAEM
jgi:hypothetical protein